MLSKIVDKFQLGFKTAASLFPWNCVRILDREALHRVANADTTTGTVFYSLTVDFVNANANIM